MTCGPQARHFLPFTFESLQLTQDLVNPIANMEKDSTHVGESPDYNGHGTPHYVDPSGVESKEGRLAEAVGIYGNVEIAEEMGYVTRGYVLAHAVLRECETDGPHSD